MKDQNRDWDKQVWEIITIINGIFSAGTNKGK